MDLLEFIRELSKIPEMYKYIEKASRCKYGDNSDSKSVVVFLKVQSKIGITNMDIGNFLIKLGEYKNANKSSLSFKNVDVIQIYLINGEQKLYLGEDI